jgi:hypothetical protein
MAVYNRVAEFVRLQSPTVELSDVESVPVDGVEVADLLGVRSQITALKTELVELASAPLPSAELKARIREYVGTLASRGAPRIDVSGERFRVSFDDVDVLGNPLGVASIVAWIEPGALAQRLEASIMAMTGGHKGVSAREREQRAAGIADQVLRFERHEESLVEALLGGGVDVQRRLDCSPMAILQVTIKRNAAAA